jgi:hypothetical protein
MLADEILEIVDDSSGFFEKKTEADGKVTWVLANRRTYVLELEDGEPVFRRDEFCLAFDSALNEVFGPKAGNDGDDIVPQKLSKLFPGRRRSQDV